MSIHAATPITVLEVAPRDGLQHEINAVPTEAKVEFVDALSRTGLTSIEVSGFVSPRWAPKLADAELVFARIRRSPGVRYAALVPNLLGLERALAAGVDQIAVFTAATDDFNRRNVNTSVAGSIARFRPVLSRSPVPVRAYVATAFQCPFSGPVSPLAVADVTQRLLDLGCTEISLADTMGLAAPDDVRRLLDRVLWRCPAGNLAMHFHDAHGQAIANVRAALAVGVTRFDTSAGGLGGCPHAHGTARNVATESLVAAFPERCAVDVDRLAEASGVLAPYWTVSAA